MDKVAWIGAATMRYMTLDALYDIISDYINFAFIFHLTRLVWIVPLLHLSWIPPIYRLICHQLPALKLEFFQPYSFVATYPS